jgi:hypothetical protein
MRRLLSLWLAGRISALEASRNPVYCFVMTKDERRTGRPPIHSRAMSGAERQARYVAKLAASQAKTKPPASVTINLNHLRQYPDRIAPWLHRELGHAAAIALRDALDRAIKNKPEEVDQGPH